MQWMGEIVEVVNDRFIFLEALVIRDGLCDKELRRRIAAMGYENTGESSWPVKWCMNALVFPVSS